MDWHSIPSMRLETRFGDRVVPAFCERPASVWAMIAAAAERNPDGEALVCRDRRLSWREIVERAAQIATGFQRLGLQRGDRIGVLLGNRVEFVLTMFAAAHAGLVTGRGHRVLPHQGCEEEGVGTAASGHHRCRPPA